MRALLLVLFVAVACFGGPPRRVVSQTVGSDELLLALADPDQIAALSHLSRNGDFSLTAKEAERHPQLLGQDAEAILRHHPDLVLVASYSQAELVAQLRRAGIRMICFEHFESLEESYANLRLLGRELGHPERAEALIQACQTRATALARRLQGVKPVRVLCPSIYGYTAGRGTTFQDICDHTGALNVAAEAGLVGHMPTPAERVLTWNPEVLVVSGRSCEEGLAPYRERIPYRSLPALRQSRCALLPRNLMSCVTHRRVEAYEQLARALHPERFR
ncbi:ABC transporter substrate-binding protein [Geothrix limicola]|uniref:ABC transporter substrate-binding protein n=2 Tax=Geothrix limicola TaxID=2927978 RepID=A0ABQ5QG17_9BACT|nr:ABC transporter substrate-binding protein [Geothrix limicola]